MLYELLKSIAQQSLSYDISISVYDDASDIHHSVYTVANLANIKFNYFRFAENNGKKKYFNVINKAFSEVTDADYYFMIPDDMVVHGKYFTKSIEIFNSIRQYDKVCMNTDIDDRLGKECWTGYTPVDHGNVFRAQWVDMCFIANKTFFDNVGKINVGDRWKQSEQLGSGVGSVISRNLHKKGFGLYHCKEQLTIHLGQQSMMHR